MPDSWVAKYKQVKAAGLIADVPVPTASPDGLVQYPKGTDPASKDVCNWESSQCFMDDTINVAPDGVLAIGFDDGPTEAVAAYADYFKKEQIVASHFLIGLQILTCPSCMTTLVNMEPEQHLASHSFTHTQLPLMQDLEVVADIGWSLQVIYDYSGKIPLYLRPPQGDIDRRVMTIAREVFGVQVVMWNEDLLDWCLLEAGDKETLPDVCKGTTLDSINKAYTGLMDATPQKGVLLLVHEIRNASQAPFHTLIAGAKEKKWKIGPVTDVDAKLPWYENAATAGVKGEAVDDILTKRKPFTVAGGGSTITMNGDWSAGAGGNTSAGGSTSGKGKGGASAGGNSTQTNGTDAGSGNGTTGAGSPSASGSGLTMSSPIAAALGAVAGLVIAGLVTLQ